MRAIHFICFVALIAGLSLAHAASRPGPPKRCLATGSCKAPAPACTSDEGLFFCNQTTGAWQSNRTELNVSLTIGGPVVFLGDFALINNASITFNESDKAIVTVLGFMNFSGANNTWVVKVDEDDLDDYAEVEKEGSKNYNDSARQLVKAYNVTVPPTWKIKTQQAAACHVVYLTDYSPAWFTTYFNDTEGKNQTGTTFTLYFYTKSACWKWVILLVSILAYLVLLILLVVAFRVIPSLKRWTAQPVFNSNMSYTSVHKQHIDDESYELDERFGGRSSDNENTDSVRLDI